jgi:predicted transcriptional regulator of viral defense system
MKEAGLAADRLGVFRACAFVKAGFPREYLRRLIQNGRVQKLSRGLYAARTFDGDSNQSFVEVSKRFPRAVICLLSALRFHQIGTQSPFQVWLALPRGSNFPRAGDSPLRFCKFSKASYAFGVQDHKVLGGTLRVTSPAKTIADCFKYRNKYGIDVAVEALRDGWMHRKFTMNELIAAAEVCRVRRVIQPYLEMLT